MSPPLPQVPAVTRGPAHLLRQSAQLFSFMMADRRTAARPADPRTPDEVLADLVAAIPPELPGLVGAFAMRSATCGAYDGVAA